jgi:hypothetical protein
VKQRLTKITHITVLMERANAMIDNPALFDIGGKCNYNQSL